jgi:ABC-type Zn uptake system ZnuABC Zn-binding protein ZnuA
LILCIGLIVDELARLDPANQQHYRTNAAGLITAVETWRENLRRRWQSEPPRALTDHRFLQHFAQDMGLLQITSIQDHHDAHGSLKDLSRIEKQLQQNPVSCLLTLESMPSPIAARLAAKYQLRTISITTGIDTNPERSAILRRLDQLAASLDQCLTVDQKKP